MDLLDFLEQHHDTLRTSRSDEVRINCPFCDDTKFHGYFNVVKGVYHCFKCNVAPNLSSQGYTAWGFLKTIHRLSHKEIKDILGDRSVDIRRINAKSLNELIKAVIYDQRVPTEPEYLVALPPSKPVKIDSESRVGQLAWDYMRSRLGGRTDELIARFNIRYTMEGDYAGRIILPVYDYFTHELIYFQARAFLPPTAKPPYLNPKVERPLFVPFSVSDEYMILCEGYFDALVIGDGAAAVFGSNLTEKQVKQILAIGPLFVVVCFDDDKPGITGARKVCKRLRPYVREVRVVTDLFGKDPAQLGANARTTIIRKSKPFNIVTEVETLL